MYEAIPMCAMCGLHEAGSLGGGSIFFCGGACEDAANSALDAMYADLDGDTDGEPMGSYDLSDDAEWLASAGYGTDEDYGYYGGEDY